jgi:hypothetical protein
MVLGTSHIFGLDEDGSVIAAEFGKPGLGLWRRVG